MRSIVKNPEPAELLNWKALANENWAPTYADLRHPEKGLLLQALLAEQYHCCCYCGREITESDSHIEHFRPQSTYEELELEYNNLHASCVRFTDPQQPLHCGHSKENWFDEENHISPLQDGCELRFHYLLTGDINPCAKNDSAAQAMIDNLTLNVGYLSNRRKNVLIGMFDEDFLLSATESDLDRIIKEIRVPDNGALTPFSHVISRFAQQLRDN